MVKVKICGVKSLDTALTAVNAGADYLGFNFVHTSKNYIKPEKAKEIINQVKGKVQVVGVFQDERVETVNQIAQELALDLVQLHGLETIGYCEKLEKPVIKVFLVPSDFDLKDTRTEIELYKVDFYMLDREKRGIGEILNPAKVKELVTEFPIFLAGGLSPENIGAILEEVKPFAVDVSAGIETEGVKDNEKIKKFIELVKKGGSPVIPESSANRESI